MNKNILTFDCETTGLIQKGLNYKDHYNKFPHIVQLAWEFEGVMKNYIIKPDGYIIPKDSEAIHGISTELALDCGVDLIPVLEEFLTDCYTAKKIVGHNTYFDTSIIKANALRFRNNDKQGILFYANEALHKSKRIDTRQKSTKFMGLKQEGTNRPKWPSLVELHQRLFNESFPAHNAKHDVIATKRCYEELVKRDIINL